MAFARGFPCVRHVGEGDEKVGRQRAHSLGEYAMLATSVVRADDTQATCNPPTKKHQLKVEISRKLLQGEFL